MANDEVFPSWPARGSDAAVDFISAWDSDIRPIGIQERMREIIRYHQETFSIAARAANRHVPALVPVWNVWVIDMSEWNLEARIAVERCGLLVAEETVRFWRERVLGREFAQWVMETEFVVTGLSEVGDEEEPFPEQPAGMTLEAEAHEAMLLMAYLQTGRETIVLRNLD